MFSCIGQKTHQQCHSRIPELQTRTEKKHILHVIQVKLIRISMKIVATDLDQKNLQSLHLNN